jgi:hypothetical protein
MEYAIVIQEDDGLSAFALNGYGATRWIIGLLDYWV